MKPKLEFTVRPNNHCEETTYRGLKVIENNTNIKFTKNQFTLRRVTNQLTEGKPFKITIQEVDG